MRLLGSIICFLGRLILSLRYRVEVRGLEKLPRDLRGALILPNHPAYIDPILLGMHLWPRFHMRPIGAEYVVKMPVVSLLNWMMRGVAIPSLDTSINQFKIRKAQQTIQTIIAGLKSGDNFLIYPRGRLRATDKEEIGGASGTREILSQCPDAPVLLIRTTGLWGSSFSRGFWHGDYPELQQVIWNGIKTVLKNGIFFTPRRKVLIEIEMAPKDLPRQASRLEVNRYLENWYNQKKDPLTVVPTRFWNSSIELPPKNAPSLEKQQVKQVSIDPKIQERIYQEIRTILEIPDKKIDPSMSLSRDLGMDSLNVADLVIFLTQNYPTKEIYPETLQTVADALEAACGQKDPAAAPSFRENHFQWPEEKGRPELLELKGATIPEAFLHSTTRMGSYAAIADDHSGVLSFARLKKTALVLSRRFALIPESRVAVMLPASVGAYVTIMALELAGKTPVMLNWTLGPRYLEDMMRISGAKTILSSWRFLERLSYVDFGKTADQIQFLEDIRKEISLGMKLKGLFLSWLPTRMALKAIELDKIDPKAPAVILFTSGTESAPKAVPLSHENIITNLCDGKACVDLIASDICYGILPPFHSFGFSVTGLYPILIGVRSVFYPDPTDSFSLAQDIEHWKVTVLFSAPTFLKGLFSAAKKEQLLSVRYFIAGAEKTPPQLLEQVADWQLPCRFLEGYGITECSPCVSVQRPENPPKGVGTLLPSLEACTIHPETLEPLPPGAIGELCFRGPSVFYGYLTPVASPFIEIGGQEWYRSGDMGCVDENRTVILTDRLKRFVKIGGEMISLGAVESALIDSLKIEGKSLAVIEGEPGKLVLFATFPIDREAANKALLDSGLSRLIKISAVHQIDELPVLGTGKTNYRQLKTLCS